MGSINQRFKIIWSPKTTAWCKEIRNMIAESCIIRMLLNGHYLESIVAKLLYTRKYIISKLCICIYFRLLTTHSNMTFIYSQ
nr:hypothetical protein MtrunA17_Chr7g0265951 [Ipomoea batatas]GMD41503.1 hypothetical protein MtrunA17_Chr7g0265951 [Ipomoea batatas]GMD44455.1 hypothetical protein MtrunA17_Chr7g0265951 [Ipomoea batatas]GMD46100.1 hypothetical protein MtrunA17_Chr7g0265951 [Ipomoea batatas]GME18058.1 hypothetical protein MtrunA17_Chr7g0265951 [Ipomoea batatas]